jgi:copper resistance protein B
MNKIHKAARAATVAAALLPGLAVAQETGLVFWGVQMEQLEYRAGDEGEDVFAWEGDAYVGTDEWKLRWLGEGEQDLRDSATERLENQLVVQKPVADFFDAKAGFRLDTPDGPDRWYGLIGVSGLAQQWFEVDANLFVSENADVSVRFEVEYELLLTNRLILTPVIELDLSATEDREIGVGKGLSSGEFGLRLSYDLIDRSVAPYVGVTYERKFFDTADFARQDGEGAGTLFGVVGLRVAF